MEEEFPYGIKLNKPKDIPKEKEWGFTAEDLELILKRQEDVALIRGKVISSALYVEHELDYFLCRTFFKDNSKEKELFRELLLEKEFFTFMQKWKLLGELLDAEIIKLKEQKDKKRLRNYSKFRIFTGRKEKTN